MSSDRGRVTRRGFVAGSLATGAAAAVPAAAEAKRRKHKAKFSHHRKADVVIIGAGFAGLSAARRLHQAGKSVIVLEARNRVGGRVWNHDLGGGRVSERGGTFAGPTQDYVLQLASQMNVSTFSTFDNGDDVYVIDGSKGTYSDTGPTGTAPLDPLILPDLTLDVTELDNMSKSVPVETPWTASKASDWDGQTLQTWIDNNSHTKQFRDVVPAATRPIFGAEPRELSLLFVLFYIASSGDSSNPGTFERNFNTRNGAQQWRFVGGSQLIALKIAKQLGHRVILRTPVRKISQHGDRVTVISDRVTVHAKRAIVAIPPTLAGRIDYHPILPFERDQLTQRYGQGTLTKVAAVYNSPWWRAKGFTGTAIDTGGPVSATFDDSPPEGSPGVIFGFVGGDNARTYNAMSPAARRGAVLGQFASYWGPQAHNANAFFDTSWSGEQWTRGCPVGIPGLGTLLAYGSRLREPVGLIHWAGTETSDYWNGYMDGAVRSGYRAADEVRGAV